MSLPHYVGSTPTRVILIFEKRLEMDLVLRQFAAGKLFEHIGQNLNPPNNVHMEISEASKPNRDKYGRIITIFQQLAPGSSFNISDFKCYLGGSPLRGYSKLSLEYLEIVNEFSLNPLYMVGVYIEIASGNNTTGKD